MASNRVPEKVKRLRNKGHTVEFDGKTYRIDGHKLDRRLYARNAKRGKRN